MAAPENLILRQLALYRTENQAALEHIRTVGDQAIRALDGLGYVSERLSRIEQTLIKISGDLLHAENQNISRHGEALNQGRQIVEILDRMESRDEQVLEIVKPGWPGRAALCGVRKS
jgi:hypothetical protein